ncbi:voltage-gated sodium channel [Constrictibacter sp. MBR-5]|uniref:ion transporter n=1 Tax=Constrictibacter sp. MBR-5 TaxID=3156467 RepID=UPI00339517C3
MNATGSSATPPRPSLRDRIGAWVDSPLVQRVVIGLIVLNAITLGLETSPTAMSAVGPFLLALDVAIVAVFTVEVGLRLFARGRHFFRDGWNLFDLAIVVLTLAPASENLSVLRTFRILRVLRIISVVPRLRAVVEALIRSLPGLGAIAGLLVVLFYVAGVMTTKLYGASFPEWFGSVGASMYTLFQVMTLESWSMGIVRPVMEAHPYAWIFFVPFILVASFTVLNLFLAIIVNSLQHLQQEETEHALETAREIAHDEAAALSRDIAALRREIADLRAGLGHGAPPETRHETGPGERRGG